MEKFKKIGIVLIFVWLSAVIGCGDRLPFEYRYTSRDSVEIKYKEKIYSLNRFGDKVNAPFDYEFEPDGDLDITVEGKTYDIDSPYDIDKPKKKTKKKSTRKRKK